MAAGSDKISELHCVFDIEAVVSKIKKKDGEQAVLDLYVCSVVIAGNDACSILFRS